jgi:G3E family GTPase
LQQLTVFHIITGFLGSGKTTLLKNMLKNIPEGQRVAVIQNEFAPNGIDGTELKDISSGFHLVELNNGSVFCACLMGNFIASLKTIVHTYSPDLIYLEASGLADPSTLWQVLNEPELKQGLLPGSLVCMVDALNFQKALHKIQGVVNQVRMADLVVLNKTDLVSSDELFLLAEEIKRINPLAKIEETTFANLSLPMNRNYAGEQNLLFASLGQGSGRPAVQSASLKTGKKLCAEKLDSFLNEISLCSIRSKGFLRLSNGGVVLFQSVYGSVSYQPYSNYNGQTELTAIGENISPARLLAMYNQYSY